MLAQIKTIVDLLVSSVSGFNSHRSDRRRKEAVLELLVTYFTLKEVVADGRVLLASLGADPEGQLSMLSDTDATALIRKWADVAERQAGRLYGLVGHLTGQVCLDVVAPTLRDEISDLIGSKFEQTDSLHGIGAGLVFFSMFGGRDDRDWLVTVVRSMLPAAPGGSLDLEKAQADLHALEEGLERYRLICERLLTDEEIVALSAQARKRAAS